MKPGDRPLRRGLGIVTAVAALLAGATGCGAGSGRATSMTPATAANPDLPSGAEDLVGRWAHYDVVAYQGDLMKTLIMSTGFSDLELRGGRLWNVQRFCHADMGNDQNIAVSLSDGATRAIVPVDTPVAVTEVGGKLRVVRPATPTAIGIDLADPAHESLPDDPKDPRITDPDGDGHPGVTANIKVNEDLQGELYLARREIFTYDVTQESPDRLVGHITDRSEQLLLGASNELFLAKDTWKQIDDRARNPVIWKRVTAEWDCARLAAERDRIFPTAPKADW